MTITIKFKDIEAQIIRKRIKNIYLRVCHPDGNIKISAPLQTSLWKIQKFVQSKIDWILSKQKKIDKKVKNRPKKYVNNETHYFMGESYTLKIVENNHDSFVKLFNQEIILNIPSKTTVGERQTIIEKWYGQQLNLLITPILKKWEVILNVSVKKFSVRKMKTRWGSCTPKSQSIRFNLELAKTSSGNIEYVVVHELVHLLEPSHNNRFKTIMDQFYPNWKTCKKELNKLDIRE